jgi:Flagellar hook-length control protein
MVGLNLQVVGAVAEMHLGDIPTAVAPLSAGAGFAGVLEMKLPAGKSPSLEEPATPDEATTPDALQAQSAAMGLTTLPLPLTIEPTAPTDHPTRPPDPVQTLEPRLHTAGETRALQTEPTLLLEPTPAAADTPNCAAVFGDGMGDTNSTQLQLNASESLLAVEGDAPPVSARQVELLPPPSFTPMQADASSSEGMVVNMPTDRSALQPNEPSPSNGSLASLQALRLPRDEQPARQQDLRVPAATQAAVTLHQTPPAVSFAEGAFSIHRTAPNWGVAEQIAQHIERLVYERGRNSLTVRLDPPELGVVELRIQVTGSEVQAWLTAERDLTRQMLQQAQQYLREQLESRGLHLTHFDVGAQSQFQYAPREQYTRYAAHTTPTRTPTATDSLLYDGRWSVWV